MVKKKVTDYDIPLLEVQKYFPNAYLDSARGHELHIRATNVSLEQSKNFFTQTSGKLDCSGQEKRYSTSYLTHIMDFNGIPVPVVLSCGEYKVNNKDGLTQKQLTPTKLNIMGEYNDINVLLKAVESSLNKLNPQLSSFWSSSDEKELKKLLVKLSFKIVFDNQKLTKREREIVKAHKASLGKDFGEVLTAIYIIHTYGNVTIALSESSSSFDLSFLDEYGIVNKFNTKSGGGSGQTFKSVKNEFLSLDENDYKKGTSAHVCLEMIKSLIDTSQGNIKGKDRIFNLAKAAQKITKKEILGEVLQEFSLVFFNGKEINKTNYNPPSDFSTYSQLLENIWTKFNLKKIGLPSGSNEEKPNIFYENNVDGKENAILFTLATIISAYFPSKVITNIMEKLLKTKVHIIHLDFNENGVSFIRPQKITYKFHYWGNFKNPTNNLPGFKTVYEK